MALIRILVKEGLTGLYYVKKCWWFQKKNSLIDSTQYNMAIWGHIITNFGKIHIFGR